MDLADPEREESGPFDDNYRPRTLASVVDAEIALPLDECLDIAIRIATVLVALQRRHIIHRDIKPGNIIFVRGKAILADVGLAIDVRDAASIVGTPGYAPPERQGSPAGDVFGLGKTLYRISTGRQPSEEGLPPCTEADIDAPFFWKWMIILSKATARDPARRYRSAKGLLRDLRRLRAKTSSSRRIARHLIITACTVSLLSVFLPALWHLPLFYAWCTNLPDFRARVRLPYPYSLVKRFFVPKDALTNPDRFHAFPDKNAASRRTDPFAKLGGGTVLWYDFDHRNGAAKDISGMGNDGTVVGATWDKDPLGNGFFAFDGLPVISNGPDLLPESEHDFIRLEAAAGGFPLRDFTISVVCRPENGGTIIGSGENELWQREWHLRADRFSWAWHPGHASRAVGRQFFDLQFPEQIGRLQHLVVRRIGKRTGVFRDGEPLAETDAFPELGLPIYSYGLFIGNEERDEYTTYRTWNCLKGSVHHVMVWKRGLSDQEMAELWKIVDKKYQINHSQTKRREPLPSNTGS